MLALKVVVSAKRREKMKRMIIGIVIGVIFSFATFHFVGQLVMAEQNRVQFQSFYHVPGINDWGSPGSDVWILCDTANGNLVYLSRAHNSTAMWGMPNQCAKRAER